MAANARHALSQLARLQTGTGSVLAPVLPDGSVVPVGRPSVPREVRDLSRLMPVLVLVPRSAIDDNEGMKQTTRTTCLEQMEGSEDMPSPLRAAMIRFHCPNAEDVGVFGVVEVRYSTMETCHMGQPVAMTPKEFKMLEYMIKNPRRVLSRDELLNQVWGYRSYPCTRTVDTHILKLRRKLEQEPSKPRHFLTVHGAGYRFLP